MELFSSADNHLVYSINEQIKSVLCIHDWRNSSCRQVIYPVVNTTLEPKWVDSKDLIDWKFNRSNPWGDLQRMEWCSSTSFSPFSTPSWKDSNLFERQIFVIKWSTLFWRVSGKSLIHCSFLWMNHPQWSVSQEMDRRVPFALRTRPPSYSTFNISCPSKTFDTNETCHFGLLARIVFSNEADQIAEKHFSSGINL